MNLDWSEPIVLIHLWFRKGLDSNAGVKSHGGALGRTSSLYKKDLLGKRPLFLLLLPILLCLDVAVSRCDAQNRISHPVTWDIAVLGTNLTHGGIQSRKKARVWDDIVGTLN